ncbi:hypothetical protein GGR57DRAFT_508482 [Xylariaceae sp. FL1272]|nr:hypothetical protein GGR57DRAFT_508482 [Xylariaceae sp. FL1272]
MASSANSKMRHKRTRTGCERCRLQHRKCDEGKPSCERCANAGAECKYFATISFLDKNNRTLSTPAKSTPSSNASATPSLVSSSSTVPSLVPGNNPDVFSGSSSVAQHPVWEFITNQTSSGSGHRVSPKEQLINLDIDLLAATLPMPYPPTGIIPQNAPYPIEYQQPQTSERVVPMVVKEREKQHQPSVPTQQQQNYPRYVGPCSLSSDEIGLLKNYCNRVTIWLGVYNQEHAFRHLLVRLAMNSPVIIETIMRVSATYSGVPISAVTNRGTALARLQAMANPPSAEHPLALHITCDMTINTLLRYTQNPPDAWTCKFHSVETCPEFEKYRQKNEDDRRLWFALLTLMSRLELASCLMGNERPLIISRLTDRLPDLSRAQNRNSDHSTLNACLTCLVLLKDTMLLCFPQPGAEDKSKTSLDILMIDQWKHMIERLQTWHADRPPQMQEMLEIPSETDGVLPTIMFSSGAAMSANAIYHLAMYILITSTPICVSAVDWLRRPGTEPQKLTTYYHASRLCGIAIHSDPANSHCWDPLMIAAFIYVARGMECPKDQAAVDACLEDVQKAGWNLSGVMRMGREGE